MQNKLNKHFTQYG